MSLLLSRRACANHHTLPAARKNRLRHEYVVNDMHYKLGTIGITLQPTFLSGP